MRLPVVNTIVIADDFAQFRRLIRSKLQSEEFHIVAEASDGLEAVAQTTRLQPDLVLLDVQMPILNGFEAAVQIRSAAPNSKILFVSQNTDPDIAEFAMRDGAAGYLCKSAINRELLPAVKAALAGERFIGLASVPE